MVASSPDLSEMVDAARTFCAHVEHPDESPDQWLRELAQVLPRLHAAVTALDIPVEGHPPQIDVDPEARFGLFSRLHRRLGELDSYRTEFDDSHHGAPLTGSLADDLTDIYFDLRQGLNWLDRSKPYRAATVWQHSYRVHWGQHLVDANRYLYSINHRTPTAHLSRL